MPNSTSQPPERRRTFPAPPLAKPQVFAWMIGTMLGGVVGLGLMSSKSMANNPFELGVLLCISAFAVGCLGSTKFRVTVSNLYFI